jgi:large subunit ribosomal protein L19
MATGSIASLRSLRPLRFNQESRIDHREDFVMSQQILSLVEKSSLKSDVPKFAIGDTVDVHTRILEGEKERIQIFNGVVIARSGSGSREMFTVRRIVAGEGVERKFPLHSPKIAKVEVKRSGVVRRAKLYFLRDRVGKAVRLRERRGEGAEEIAT